MFHRGCARPVSATSSYGLSPVRKTRQEARGSEPRCEPGLMPCLSYVYSVLRPKLFLPMMRTGARFNFSVCRVTRVPELAAKMRTPCAYGWPYEHIWPWAPAALCQQYISEPRARAAICISCKPAVPAPHDRPTLKAIGKRPMRP